MKKSLLLSYAILLFYSLCFTVNAQVQEWQSIQNFPDSRSGAISFVIGDTAYVGTGYNGTSHLNSFYKYNADDGNWRLINDFPGAARKNAVAFVAAGKAFVGTGTDGTTQFKDFYEYDPSTGNWSPISDLPGEIRNEASSFSIDNKGYVGLGGNGTGSLNDFYEFDPATGSWTTIASLPTEEARSRAVGFTSNGKGYIASGSGSMQFTGMYSYDPASDSWTEEIFADSKLSSLQQNTAYTDEDGLVHILKSGFTKEQVIIDLTDNSLTIGGSYFEDERNRGVAFYLDGKAYAGIGLVYDQFGNGVEKNDFRRLVTIEPPEALINLRKANTSPTTIRWDYNYDDEDGFIIYLSEGDNNNYEVEDSISAYTTSSLFYTFDTLKQGVRQYVKVATYNKGGVTESEELSFYSIYNTGKLNTPELINVIERKDDSLSFRMNYFVLNHDVTSEAIIEISYDGLNYQLFDSGNVYSSDTSIIQHYKPKFLEDKEILYFRTKIIADNRENSDYSNVVEFNTEELKPMAPFISYSREKYGGDRFRYVLKFNSYNHVDSIKLITNKNDSIKNSEYLEGYQLKYETSKQIYLYPKESTEVYAVNKNIFGTDTSNHLMLKAPILSPKFGNYLLTSTKAIEFDFLSVIKDFKGYNIIERAKSEGDFEIIDTVKLNGNNYKINYIDSNVEPNATYTYRMRNYDGETLSLYSEPMSVTSQKTASWDSFREKSLGALTDSLEHYEITNIDYNDSKLFFVSTYTKKAFYFDLDEDELVSLPDIPLESKMTAFSEVTFLNNKAYYFTPKKEDGTIVKSIFLYDLKDFTWSVINNNDLDQVRYATQVDNNSLLLMVKNSSFSAWEELALYNIETKNLNLLGKSAGSSRVTYIQNLKDSLLVFNKANNVYSIDSNIENVSKLDLSTQNVLYKNSITKINSEFIQLYNGRIYDLDFYNPPYLYEKEVVRVNDDYEPTSLVFSYQDTLVYMQQYSQEGRWINNFYYKNESGLNPLVGFNVDSVGYETFEVSWADSPDEEAYVAECYKINISSKTKNYISLDTIAQNSTKFKFNGLRPYNRYVFRIFPISGDLKGDAGGIYTRTRDVIINPPKNVKLNQTSKDSIEVSWVLSEPINNVNSLEIIDYLLSSDEGEALSRSEINSTGEKQIYLIPVESENSRQFVVIRTFNNWKYSDQNYSDTILTRLNNPYITEVAYFEKEGKYQVVINDNSEFETQFKLFRKTKEQEEFELLEIIDGNQVTEFTFDDFIKDPSISYEYYVQSYIVENDSIINSSYPSDTVSTENAVLSNTPLQSDQLTIFPNPVSEHIFISSDLNVQLQQIEVLSIDGRLIKSYKSTEIIDVSKLEKGVYLLKIKAKSGEIVKRFIKE